MDSLKYDDSSELKCPTCGCFQFDFQDTPVETVEIVKCVSCKRVFTKDELIRENSDVIRRFD